MTKEMSDVELVTELMAFIGPTLVGVTAHAAYRSDSRNWAAGELDLQPDQRERLELAYKLLNDIAEEKGNDMARAWFIGSNVGIDEISPCEGLRDGLFDEVRISAKRFLDPEEMGG